MDTPTDAPVNIRSFSNSQQVPSTAQWDYWREDIEKLYVTECRTLRDVSPEKKYPAKMHQGLQSHRRSHAQVGLLSHLEEQLFQRRLLSNTDDPRRSARTRYQSRE